MGSVGNEIRSWIQTIVILGAAAWGAYTFIYKEIWVPRSAPVNVSVNLQIQKAGIANASDEKSLSAVLVDLTATNPSSRTVYLLHNIWSVYGHKRVIEQDKTLFIDSLQSVLSETTEYYTEAYVNPNVPGELIAEGRAFQNPMLKPAETIRRSILIHFPQDKYDMLDVHLLVPTETERNKVALEYKLTADKYGFLMYRKGVDGVSNEIKPTDYESIGLEATRGRAQLSLWHSESVK